MSEQHYEWRGQIYTPKGLADASGIPRSTLEYRIKNKGMSVEEAISLGGPNKLYPYHGEMLTVLQMSQRTGISSARIRDRIYDGWPAEKAADTPVRTAEAKEVEVECIPDTPTGRRYKAAQKIASQIVVGNLRQINFRCIRPMLEYAFDGVDLSYSIRFDGAAEESTARLTACYPNKMIQSTLNRVYMVNKDAIKEVQQV